MKLFEVIKENKEAIIKKALIVGGAIAGLVVVAKMLTPKVEVLEVEEDVTEMPSEEDSEKIVE